MDFDKEELDILKKLKKLDSPNNLKGFDNPKELKISKNGPDNQPSNSSLKRKYKTKGFDNNKIQHNIIEKNIKEKVDPRVTFSRELPADSSMNRKINSPHMEFIKKLPSKSFDDDIGKIIAKNRTEKIYEFSKKLNKNKEIIQRRFTRENNEINIPDFSDRGPSKDVVLQSYNSVKLIKKEVSKIVVGQDKIVDAIIRGILCDGHILLEGIPGVAKTLLIRAIGKASGCEVNRVQFTVDLLPADILGITSYTPQKGFETIKGPIFTNYLIADEINRSPPKTQSALIEAMQEKQVSIGRTIYSLPRPFFVMATRNPIESLGVYPLPEAQVDRFLFNVKMNYPEGDEEREILEKNISIKNFDDYGLKSVLVPKSILEIQKIVKEIYVSEHVKTYLLGIVKSTRVKNSRYSDMISYGSSPRGAIGLFIASKARALMEGRNYVIPEDVREVSYEVIRHRILLSYKATIKGITTDDIISDILSRVNVI